MRFSRRRTASEPSERAQRISQVVDLYLQITSSGIQPPAALLRAGAALLHDENEIREACVAISQYTGHNPLAFMKEFPNVTAKDFFRTALAESLELLDPPDVRDLGVRLMRGLLQSRLEAAARETEDRMGTALHQLDRRDASAVKGMRPVILLLEQLQISVGTEEGLSISWAPDGRSARVKAGASGFTTELYFTFDPVNRKYRIDSRTRSAHGRPGIHETVFFTLTPEEAVDHATRAIGRCMGVRAVQSKMAASRQQHELEPSATDS